MTFIQPTIQQFKEEFFRDFPFGKDPNTSILDIDIQKAFNRTNVNFNTSFFADQTSYAIGFLLLSAHFLVLNIRSSSQGLSGQYNFLQAGKGAGSVNESFSIPQRILDNPEFSMLAKTNYGAQYLFLLLPQLSGQIFTVHGHTKP